MQVLSRREWAFLAIILVYSFIPTIGGLFRIPELLGGPAIAPVNPRAVSDPLPIILHVLASFLFCLVGALQLVPSLRRKRPGLHRKLGWVVATAGCVSALTGLWMTHFYVFPLALQGPLLYWARIVLSFSMFGFIVWAIVEIRSRNLIGHRAAMLRAYAIGQGASTQTALFMITMAVSDTELLGFSRDVLMVLAWVINIATVEWLIRRMVAPRRSQTLASNVY